MSQAPSREPTRLADYRPPAYLTPTIELDFVLEPEATLVTARQRFRQEFAELAGHLLDEDRDQWLTPALIGSASRTGRYEEQALKRVWHYVARFGRAPEA